MRRVTQKWEVIDIDTYEDARHMINILNKYNWRNLWEWYSLSCLRWNVNDYIQKYIQKIPARIITPITYEGEWLEIIKKHFWLWYERDLARLRRSLCSYRKYDEVGLCVTTHNDHSWYTIVPPRDLLLLVLNPREEEQWLDWDAVHCRLENQWVSVDISKAYVEYRKAKDNRYHRTYEDILWSDRDPYVKFYTSQGRPQATSEWKWKFIAAYDMLELIQNATNKLKNNSLSLSQNKTMTTSLETTVNEAYFADKKIIGQGSKAVEILQWTAHNLNQLGKFVGNFNVKINTLKDDINSSFERRDKIRFVEAVERMNTLFEFLQWDNQWSAIIYIAEEFTKDQVEFDPEEYLIN